MPRLSPWVATSTLLQSLAISRSTLYRMRVDGELKIGKHYRVLGRNRNKPTYRWHLERVAAVMEVPLERRSGAWAGRIDS